MQVSEHYDFNRDADTVLRMFTDRDYFVAKHERLGGTQIEVIDHSDDGDAFAITVRQRVPQNTPLPRFLEKLVGPRIGITQTDTWRRSQRSGWLKVELAAAPVRVHVDMALADSDQGSRLSLTFDIHAPVPVIGGRIEKFLAGDVIARMHDDLAESERMLAEY